MNITLAVICAFLILINFSSYLYLYKVRLLFYTCTDTYVTSNDIWNQLFIAHTSVFNTVLWNDSVKYLGGQSSTVSTKLIDEFEDMIDSRLVPIGTFDIGNYSQIYHDVLFKVAKILTPSQTHVRPFLLIFLLVACSTMDT